MTTSDAGDVRFPDDFVWGASTSAYQIEGAVGADGRGESIWDRFCTLDGAIADASSGAVACDHYHRMPADVMLMRGLGLDAYRFSIAWPRIQPSGRGRPNPAGLAFYDRLVDELLESGITPFPTLYHWDLPQALEDLGGWPIRATAEAFADYSEMVVSHLGDRVRSWTTVNEPYVIANLGYLTGAHAPGRSSLSDSLDASHHVLLAHGLATERIRARHPTARVGIVVNFTPVTPVGDAPAARARQQLVDEVENRWYSDPLFGRDYPAYATEQLAWDRSVIRDGDLDRIGMPLDFWGINYYTRHQVGALGEGTPRGERTTMDWEVHPDSLGSLLRDLHARYPLPDTYVTENGAAMPDTDRVGGRIADHDRIHYLRAHLHQVHAALSDGVPLRGYFVWSLLDNFEWAWGYGPKFGIVEVDPSSLERIPKASADWYAGVARSGVVRAAPGTGDADTA